MLGGKALREAFFLVSNLICSQSEKLKCKCFMQRPCSFFASPQIIQLCHRCLTWCSSPHWLSLQQWRNTSTKAGIIWPSSSPLATTLCKEKKDGTLHVCIDCRSLNQITVTNKTPALCSSWCPCGRWSDLTFLMCHWVSYLGDRDPHPICTEKTNLIPEEVHIIVWGPADHSFFCSGTYGLI